jgi:murein L,D-transpeptidase YcbB/YkuD
MGSENMRPSLFSRVSKTLLITAAAVALACGVSDHASAQKGNYIESVGAKSSAFFSLNLGALTGRDNQIIMASIRGALDAGQVDAKLPTGQVNVLSFRDTPAMLSVYAEHDGRTLWVDTRNDNQEKAAVILKTLQNAWTHGLNPDQYHVKEIAALLGTQAPLEKAQLELLLSDALIRYGHDMTGMRLPANAIRQDPQSWRKPVAGYDALKSVSGTENIQAALDSFAPTDAFYNRLRQELMTLAESPDRALEQSMPISFSGAILRPGEFHRDVVKLRARMGQDHDPAYGSDRKYDDRLSAAVMKFQRENGLSADGVIGPQTLAMLNRSITEKMEQIVANMERLRWLDAEKPNRYILVNIPSATLWAVENGEVALQMPVIVGRPERQTKSFVTHISGVRFNPKWTVPPTIKNEDFLPKLMEDPAYLQNKGIEVSQLVDGQRVTLDSTAIDWSTVTRSDLKNLRMVQGSGDDNALGRIRVLMENPYDIYLHDTNSPNLFSKQMRALSSGCIRLADPEGVAKFILKGNANWSDGRMQNIIASGRTTEVAATEGIPVYILYQTIWQDKDGALVYGPDTYKQDRRLIEAMKGLKAYQISENGGVKYASLNAESPVR